MDYNIYIHNVSGESSTPASQTTPFQVQNQEGVSGATQGAFSMVNKTASFVSNPDAAMAAVAGNFVGTLSNNLPVVGIIVFAITALTKIADKVQTNFLSYKSPLSGDYKNLNNYTNFKQSIHNILTPFSTNFNAFLAETNIRKENYKREQENALFGGTINNSQYGRYL